MTYFDLEILLLPDGDTQAYSGSDRTAKSGAMNANDPPCTMGRLQEEEATVRTVQHQYQTQYNEVVFMYTKLLMVKLSGTFFVGVTSVGVNVL